MEDTKRIRKNMAAILGTILAIVLVPYIGKLVESGGHVDPALFEFPPISVKEKPGFSLPVFIGFSIAIVFGIILYIYPWIFGFKKPPKTEKSDKITKTKLPGWFWLGIIMFGSAALAAWSKTGQPKFLVVWADVPLFWGFALILDGIVYRRNGGDSIVQNMPRTLLAIGIASISGWLIFEYLNFFVYDNWYYPEAELIQTSQFYVYALIGSTGLMPMCIEMYTLLGTFKGLKTRYSYGPKVVYSKSLRVALLIGFIATTFAVSFFPNQLFFIIWLGPLFIFALLLDLLGIWTPFRPIAEKGDWTPLALICLAQLIMGILYESWNYLSAFHNPLVTHNPDYWIYSLPYVNIIHVFEMPLLGLFGYIPFGAYIWIWWIVVAYALNIPPFLVRKDSHSGLN